MKKIPALNSMPREARREMLLRAKDETLTELAQLIDEVLAQRAKIKAYAELEGIPLGRLGLPQ